MTAIVYTACSAMPSSCRGIYRDVHVVDVRYDIANRKHYRPSSIRSKDIKTIVQSWYRCNVGTTERCCYYKALAAAEALCRQYNSAGDAAEAEQLIGAGGSA